MDDLNEKYYKEGWGHVCKLALGIETIDCESQAKKVCQFAYREIETMNNEIIAMRTRMEG